MTLFYADQLSEKGGILSVEESHHAARVLRMQEGDEILTTQGKGIIYHSRLSRLSKKEARFENLGIHSQEERKRYLHIAMAPTKSNDRFENFLEKATEAGIDEVTPLICHHSERKVYKTERGEKVIKAAAKQSLANWWPHLNEPMRFSDFLKSDHSEEARFIAHCEDMGQGSDLPDLIKHKQVLMLIGPEGDFSHEEIEQALATGFKAARLGPKRLRTETAGMAVAFSYKLL